MATVYFRMGNGDTPFFHEPTLTKAELKAKIDRALSSSQPSIALMPAAGGPLIVLPKSEIKKVIYEN